MYQPLFSRLLKEDLGKDAPKWADRIIYQGNQIVDYLKVAFAKGMTIQDNLLNPIKTMTIKATGVPATDTSSFLVSLPSGYQPLGVVILNCIDLSGTIVGSAVTCEMLPGTQNGNVVVRAIYGLTAGHSYAITFMVF
jgi:hypothetical protein